MTQFSVGQFGLHSCPFFFYKTSYLGLFSEDKEFEYSVFASVTAIIFYLIFIAVVLNLSGYHVDFACTKLNSILL